MSAEFALKVENFSVSYGPNTVLHSISIEVTPGELVAILGANGAGKTTLMHGLSGVVPHSCGEINLFGVAIGNLPADKRVAAGLALVPEGRLIFPRLTVLENLELGAFSLPNGPERQILEKVYQLFPILEKRKFQLGGTLSGGEQQMLALGRALMSKPKMLLLDEPSMGVAPMLVEKIFETISLLNQEGLSVLLVEQNAALALSVSSRAYVLELGRIPFFGQSSDLRQDQRIREAYLGGCNT